MIEVNFKRTDNKFNISLKGHANYAPHGQDIVCSAVSVLYQTLEMSIEDLTESRMISKCDGDVRSLTFYINEDSILLLESFFIGIKGVADTYPNHVKIV